MRERSKRPGHNLENLLWRRATIESRIQKVTRELASIVRQLEIQLNLLTEGRGKREEVERLKRRADALQSDLDNLGDSLAKIEHDMQ